MEGKIRLAVFGQKRLSREGGIEMLDISSWITQSMMR